MFSKKDVTFVIIGKNEELNLNRCFKSVKVETNNIIYVDSNSTDNSINVAKKNDIIKIIKFNSNYYTASLARHIGAKHVKSKLIHFLDGDMTLANGWLEKSIDFMNSNKKIAVVHGYKKEYKNDLINFSIKKDSKNWQSDYLQGSYLIKTKSYFEAGELDSRFPGEEERDLYVRIFYNGGQVWYLDQLMASHYDFKKRGFKYLFVSNVSVAILIPLFKFFNFQYFLSYLFVYRRLVLVLFFELLSFISFLFSGYHVVLVFIIIQLFSLLYCLSIKRIGYFILWKSAFLNFIRVFKLINRKAIYKIDIIKNEST